MSRRFHLEHPDNEELIAKCGFDRERGFVVDVFLKGEPTASYFGTAIVGALDFLVEQGFLTEADLQSAHHVVFDNAASPMTEGVRMAFETVINFLQVVTAASSNDAAS